MSPELPAKKENPNVDFTDSGNKCVQNVARATENVNKLLWWWLCASIFGTSSCNYPEKNRRWLLSISFYGMVMSSNAALMETLSPINVSFTCSHERRSKVNNFHAYRAASLGVEMNAPLRGSCCQTRRRSSWSPGCPRRLPHPSSRRRRRRVRSLAASPASEPDWALEVDVRRDAPQWPVHSASMHQPEVIEQKLNSTKKKWYAWKDRTPRCRA